MQPVAHVFDAPDSTGRIVDSYIRAIDIFSTHYRGQHEASDGVDLILLLRFDLWFLKPLHLFNPDATKANLLVRDRLLSDSNFTSDLLFLLPARYLDAMRDALNASGDDCLEDGISLRALRLMA